MRDVRYTKNMSDFQFPKIQSDVLILKDGPDGSQSQLIFHVENGDYFAMIATLLGFVEESAQKLQEKDEAMKVAQEQIALLRANLMYLQENYTIEPKKPS